MTRIPLFPLLATLLVACGLARAQTSEDVLEATSVRAGVAVHLGSTDGKLEIDLSASGRWLVQGLTLDPAQRDRARGAVDQARCYGLATVQQVNSYSTLPYASDLVNLVVADLDALGLRATTPAGTRTTEHEEIRRVLRPDGVAYLKIDGRWQTIRKPRPEEMDDWTHYDHGPNGNPVSADALVKPVTALRWYASPSFTESQGEREAGLRLTGGRLVYAIKNYDIEDRVDRKKGRHHLVCRDAHNGTLLWKRAISSDPYTPYRHELVVSGDRVYLKLEETGPMVALDAATGKTVVTYDQGAQVEALELKDRKVERGKRHLLARLYRGRLIQAYQTTLHVLDAASGEKLWEYSPGPEQYVPLVVAADDKVFVVVGQGGLLSMRGTMAVLVDSIVALDVKTGDVEWTNEEFAGNYMIRLVHEDGLLPITYFPGQDRKDRRGEPMQGFGHKFGVAGVRASDGKTIWKSDKLESAGGHYAVTFVRDGNAYVACERYIGYDLKSGESSTGIAQRTFVNSCAETRATPDYILYGMSFADRENLFSPRAIARSTCDTGVFPANGLIYCSPPKCTCLDVVAGYTATAPEPPPKPLAARLIRGQKVESSPPKIWPAPDEWPMYMANPQRGNWTPSAVGGTIREAWRIDVGDWPEAVIAQDWKESESPGGLVSAPIIAGQAVYVSVPNSHRVEARDLRTGDLRWSYTTGGRVDTPPTVYGELCLFGSRDGWVYALGVDGGNLVWRYCAAVRPKYIVDNGHLESPWPLTGTVMIHRGQAWILAGRHSAVDEGIQVHCLDPLTGRLHWQTRIASASLDRIEAKEIPDYPNHGKVGIYYPRAAQILVSDGGRLHHYVETLKDKYRDGETIELHATNGRWGKVLDARDMTWLRSNLMGFIGRRTESIGRWDHDGVSYSDLQAQAIVLADGELYCAEGKQSRTKTKFGQLTRVPLEPDGKIAAESTWYSKIQHQSADGKRTTGNFATQAMIVAGDRLFLAGHERSKADSALHAYATRDGSKLAQWTLPSCPVRNGLAAARGYLVAACENGELICLEGGADAE